MTVKHQQLTSGFKGGGGGGGGGLGEGFALAAPSPSSMPAWYPLRLDPWQLSLKYSNSATELPSDFGSSVG